MHSFFVVTVPASNDFAFPPGALYSRKFTIDGEQISLQVQDTPFVSLEVKHLLSASVVYNTVTISCWLPALSSVSIPAEIHLGSNPKED